jgi:hypothetical protein
MSHGPHNLLVNGLHDDGVGSPLPAHARGRLAHIGCRQKPYGSLTTGVITEQVRVEHSRAPHTREGLNIEGSAYVVPRRTTSGVETEGGHPAGVRGAEPQCLPVVTTNHAHIVGKGVTGSLVRDEEAGAVAAGIQAFLLFDLGKIGSLARARALSRRGPTRMRTLLEAIYRLALWDR